MIPLILLSASPEPPVLPPLISALGGRDKATIEKEGSIEPGGSDYLISLRRKMPGIEGPAVAVICSWQGGKRILPGFVRAVALSDDRRARRALRMSGCSAVCCGMSSADSLTLSSITDESAVITVQRELSDLAGKVIEPCDMPVELTRPLSPGVLMLSAAAALICGERPQKI